MADEKRRLIYELLVEAKGAKGAGDDLDDFSKQLGKVGALAKNAVGILAAGFAVQGIGEALDELTKFNQAMGTLGVVGDDASAALHNVQSIAFSTMNAMAGVTDVYKEAIQLQGNMGRSTEDAARTAEAFIRIANAEGRSVQQAAQAVSMLSFALERGALPAKEFTSMLRDSPTFAKAAQEALGLTTEQLANLAKEGELGSESLTKIILQMEKIGKDTDTAASIGGIVEMLKTLSTTIVQAIAEGAGFNATIGTAGITGMKVFLDSVRGVFLEIGGIIRIINNALQEMFNVASLIINVALNPLEAGQAWEHYKTEVQRDLQDMAEGAKQFKAGLLMGTDQDPNYNAAAQAAKAAEQAERDRAAIAKGAAADRERVTAKEKAEQEKRDREALEAYRAKLERMAEFDREYQDMRKRVEKDTAEYLADFRKQNEKKIQEEMEKLGQVRINGLEEQIFAELDLYEESAYVIKDTFADLFSGGISNARDFFAQVTQGLLRLVAQMAAMRLTQSLMGIFGSITGAATGSAGAAARAGVSAMGNVFDHGARVAFANGGIVSGPTVFPMASGGVGLMGEAGPEAVMPLKRMGDGRLGVSAGLPNIQIVNQTGVAAKARVTSTQDRMSIVLEAARMGASMAENQFNRSLRTGYGPSARSVESTYGLRRRV